MRRLFFPALVLVLACSCKRIDEPSPEARACHEFATEWNNWSQGLTDDGKSAGRMIVNAVNGTPPELEIFETLLADFEQKVSTKAAEYERKPLPEVSELRDYRDLVVDYLRWQGSEPIDSMREAMSIAIEPKLEKEQKAQVVMRLLTDPDTEERAWKDQMDKGAKKLEQWVAENG